MTARIKFDAHVLAVAKTGGGKTKLLELIAFDMQRKTQRKRNAAMVIIDVHGDSARSIMNFIHNEDRDRLVYISSTINRECHTQDTYTAIVNPFEVSDKSIEATSIYANEIADALVELLESASNTYNSLSIQMSALLRPAIFTVMYSSPNPSLETLARFFLDKNGVNADLVELGKQSPIPMYRQFFEHDWNSLEYTLTKRSIRTKILYFLADPMLSAMICGKSTVNIEQCLREGKILVVNVSKSGGKFCSAVFSRLLIAHIHAIMLRRDAVELKDRKPCYLFLDEFQTMITQSLVSSLAECRKYGLTLLLASQSINSLSKEVKNAVMVNCGIKMIGLTDHEGKTTFSRELDVPMTTFDKLQSLRFVCKKMDGKHKPFTVRIPILPRRYFLPKAKRKQLLDYLVYQSGTYVKVPQQPSLSPAPPFPNPTQPLPPKPAPMTEKKRKARKDDPFDNV